MCLLFETIKIINGETYNLFYHQQRVAKSSIIELLSYIEKSVAIPKFGVYKLRIIYSKNRVYSHSLELYIPKNIASLKIIIDDNIDYHKKFDNRTCLNNLTAQKGEYDDILIIKNGVVSDTSFANIVFFDGNRWVTPHTPLLEGTCRARLIIQKFITPKIITFDDLKSFSQFMIINAMLDFDTQRAVKYYFDGNNMSLEG